MLAEGCDPMRDRASPRALIFEHGVPIAEINRNLMRRRTKAVGFHIDADIAQKTEIPLMRRQSVVAVVTVLHQEFPVRTRAVGLLSRDDFHPKLGLVGYQIQIL